MTKSPNFKQVLKPIFFLLLSCWHGAGSAQVKLPRLINDGMVLQRNVTLKIWGWASPHEKITLRFKNLSYKSSADEKGNWSISLPSQKAGGPWQMTINARNEISIKDILIGDVWLCSGQSNMELMMERLKYKYPEEISSAGNPNIRQFTVPDKYDFIRQRHDVEAGTWLAANPKNILAFSAVGYFFAKELYKTYKIPIGLINAALGGSPAEAWISEQALRKFPAYYQELQKFKRAGLISEIEDNDRTATNNWYKQLNETDEGLQHHWIDPAMDDSDWKQMEIPGYWADTEAGFFNGSAWFRKEFDVPKSMVGKAAKLELGRIVDADSVFINGLWVGTTGYQYPPRRYDLPAGIIKNGKNNIVIRVISNSGRGGFVPGKPYQLTIDQDTIQMQGQWKYKAGAVMKALPSQTFVRWKPAGLFNGMIAPLTNYAIKGALWYQGEANADRSNDYKKLMQTLIQDWRDKWNRRNLPFIYVQLANYMEPTLTPRESSWAAMRQQQLNILSVPNTAMAVAIDAGEWNDIHPENKKDIGKRLALQAQKIAYGDKTIISSGPLYQSMKIEGNKIIIRFSNTGSGLLANGNNELKHFAIAGADRKYVWAKAIIKGNTIIVGSDAILYPVSVRYAWADNPEGANLYNREGLPASPFTTDK